MFEALIFRGRLQEVRFPLHPSNNVFLVLEFNITLFAVIVPVYPVLSRDGTVMSQSTVIIQLLSSDFLSGLKKPPGPQSTLLYSNLQQSLITLLPRLGRGFGGRAYQFNRLKFDKIICESN